MRYCIFVLLLLSGCANTETVRTSANTFVLYTSAAPVCGSMGSLKIAQKMAAVETIKAGYDRYVFIAGDMENNVTSYTAPGTYHTNGQLNVFGNSAYYSSSSYYQPGPTYFSGGHDTYLHVKMFKKGDKGYSKAVSARETLGENWQKLVSEGVRSCS